MNIVNKKPDTLHKGRDKIERRDRIQGDKVEMRGLYKKRVLLQKNYACRGDTDIYGVCSRKFKRHENSAMNLMSIYEIREFRDFFYT